MATNFIQQAKKLKEHTQLKEVGIRRCLSKTDRDTLRESVKEMKKLNSERTLEQQDLFFLVNQESEGNQNMETPNQARREQTANKHMSIMYTNADGLCSKLPELKDIIQTLIIYMRVLRLKPHNLL